MASMTRTTVGVTGGVDTHGQSHHAAVIDHLGRQLGDREFPASPAGYGTLVEWLQGHGELDRVGVEGTGAYGAALARHLREAGILIVEVDRPDRRARRAHGKSDPLDAYSAARAALSGAAASCRSYATAGWRRSGRFASPDPALSKPEVRPRIKSNP
jgi:transposase